MAKVTLESLSLRKSGRAGQGFKGDLSSSHLHRVLRVSLVQYHRIHATRLNVYSRLASIDWEGQCREESLTKAIVRLK